MLVSLAVVVALVAGFLVGRLVLLAQLAAWMAAHPTAALVLRESLSLDSRAAIVRRTIESALDAGERVWIAADNHPEAEAFARDHHLAPDQVRIVTDPRQVRGARVHYWVSASGRLDTDQARRLADALNYAVWKNHTSHMVFN